MRVLACALGCAVLMLGCEQLAQELSQSLGGGGSDAGSGEATTAGDGGAAAKGAVGGGCATEAESNANLCAAISTCPSVTVDARSMPHCGFRLRNGVADLVCACGAALCPMGVFTTCSEAKSLLDEQTEQGVCVQVADGRCTSLPSTTPAPASTVNPACDRQCVKDCGGGEACSAVCNCS